MSESGNDKKDKKQDEDDDLRSRFPDPDADPRLRTPRRDALPEAPQIEFKRPTLKRPDAPGRGAQDTGLGNLRAMGAASTIGITLVACIAIGTGAGWAVDTFLLHSVGTPWGLIVGFFVGVASGFVNLVRVANRLNQDGDG